MKFSLVRTCRKWFIEIADISYRFSRRIKGCSAGSRQIESHPGLNVDEDTGAADRRRKDSRMRK